MALALGGRRATAGPDYGAPPTDRMARGGRAVFFSDFLGDLDALTPALAPCRRPGRARLLRPGARRDRGGVALRRPDDLREHGRRHRVRDPAGAGRCARPMRERLAARRRALAELARATSAGACAVPPTPAEPPRSALLWLYMAVGGRAMTHDRTGRLPRALAAGRAGRAAGALVAAARRAARAGAARPFPGVRLLLGLTDPEKMPERTPWWLLLLRLLALAAAILAFAGPVLNPRPRGPARPLLVLIDGGWGDAPDWARAASPRGRRARRGRARRPAGGDPVDGRCAAGGRGASPWRGARADGASGWPGSRRRPWAPDRARPGPPGSPARDGRFETLWLSDGIGARRRGGAGGARCWRTGR